ncbi:MAG: preprotein translocase subunit SecD, partial [Actinomycetota bacterium]|nr:preprotein translocase subunit SecD [Actinomycetota bacterium]
MAINPYNRGPLRKLLVLLLLIAGLYAGLGAAHTWGGAQLTPKLGLDLQGGTQLILKPKTNVVGQTINEGQVQKAVDIIRARVDGSGVAEAEVTTQGSNIVVSLPGKVDNATVESLQKSSQLRLRAVLIQGPAAPQPTPKTTQTATVKPNAPATGKPKPTATSSVPSKPTGAATSAPKSGFPAALAAATTPAPTATAAPTAKPGAKPTPQTTVKPTAATPPTPAKPKNASDLAWVTPDLQKAYVSLDCADRKSVQAIVDNPAKPMVTCDADGQTKYILGPVELVGSDIKNASSGQQQTQGGSTGIWEVRLDFNAAGTKAFCDVTTRIAPLQQPRNESAFVLDNKVISAPAPQQGPLCAGSASITGNFTATSAKVLADQLKFGALPLSFGLETQEAISPTLGGEQLSRGLLAGGIGLLLVVGYSLFQYRALGLVTVSSLLIASAITYAAVSLFGGSYGFRL